MLNQARIAVLVSGGGTNLEALLRAQESGALPHGRIVLVVSSTEGAYALTRAANHGVPGAVIRKKNMTQEAFEATLSEKLKESHIDMIILAGFLSILSADFVKQWPERIINIHPSLIPSFCGKGMYGLRVHEAALERGVKFTGATVHLVAEAGGDPSRRHTGDAAEACHGAGGMGPAAAGGRTACQPNRTGKGAHSMNVYEIGSLREKLTSNPYPGRGIMLGMSADGKTSVAAYFIMGRSVNSRNRVFLEESDGIRTEAFDASRMADPSLIIYHPVRELGRSLIVTNGDQTNTIRNALEQGLSMEQALRSRQFEPDGPNWTPRISGLVCPDGSYKLSILKSADAAGSACVRQFFEYPALPGLGHFLHTYVTDGDPIPTFRGEPERVAIEGDIDGFTDMVWQSLNEDNKISLFVRFTNLQTREYRQRIVNKHQ